MSEWLINWEKLKPYDRDQYRSFEAFCYQIATTLYEREGRFTSVDDSEGGDGVEFYLTLPSGDQWGWQAKFYYPETRLTGSRRTSVKDSPDSYAIQLYLNQLLGPGDLRRWP